MTDTSGIAITRHVDRPFDRALADTRAALQAQGFGIVSELDMRDTLKQKIGAEFSPYMILGACDPRIAQRLLTEVPEIGVLLPCTVIVRADGAGSAVSAFDPEQGMASVDSGVVREAAAEAKARLATALDSLAGS